MVHTRNQHVEDENLVLRTTPRKVCDRQASRKAIASPRSSRPKKPRLMFSPEPPREHAFHLNDPPCRRLDFATKENADDVVIGVELEQRGLPHTTSIGARERLVINEALRRDLVRELEQLHFLPGDPSEPLEVIQGRLELANTLRRRSELRRARLDVTHGRLGETVVLPHELPLHVLRLALKDRRIAHSDLDHYHTATALERALLKEDIDGLVGEGFAFGRRFVSVDDLLKMEDPNDNDLRDILGRLGETKVPRTKAAKRDMVEKIVSGKESAAFMASVRTELLLELKRRNLLPADADVMQTSELFNVLFTSGKWRDDYDTFADVKHFPDASPSTCSTM